MGADGRGRALPVGALLTGSLLLLLTLGLGASAINGRQVAAATASLTDDAGGLAIFPHVTGLSPGTTASSCLVVAADGAGADDMVRLTATDLSGELAPHLVVTVEAGSGGSYGDCTGFTGATVFSGTLAELAATADGVDTSWHPGGSAAGSASRTFRFTVGVPDGTSADAALGRSVRADFVWRVVGDPAPPPVTPPPTTPTPTVPTPTPTAPAPTTPPVAPTSSPSPSSTATAVPPVPTRPTPSASPPQLTITPPLSLRLTRTVAAIVHQPATFVLPWLLAAGFLLVQHLIDRRDPKLAAASRTRKGLTMVFRNSYRDTPDERFVR